MKNELIKFDITDLAISEMKNKTADLKVTDNKERADVTVHLLQVKKIRVAVEAKRVELKADAIAFGRNVDKEAGRIKELLLEVENPLKEMRTKYDDKKEAEKAEKERIEAERVAAVQKKMDDMRGFPECAVSETACGVKSAIQRLTDIEITQEEYNEFFMDAKHIKKTVLAKLEDIYTSAVAREAEDERLEKERKDLEEKRIKMDKLEAARKKKAAAEQKVKDDAEAKRQAAAKKERDAMQAERDAMADEKRVLEEERIAFNKSKKPVAPTPIPSPEAHAVKVSELAKDPVPVVEPEKPSKYFTVLYKFKDQDELDAWFEKDVAKNIIPRGGNVAAWSAEDLFAENSRLEDELEAK